MKSVIICTAGKEQPEQVAETLRLKCIRDRAKASEAVVNLLCDLAFGEHPDLGWPASFDRTFGEVALHG